MFRAYHTKYETEDVTPQLFFDTSLMSQLKEYSLINPVLKTEVGKAGSFSFTLPISNIEYDNFEDLISYIDVYRNDDLIFSGRVFEISKDLYGQMVITCEGLLAIFNDSIFYPITGNWDISGLLSALLESHNDQMSVDPYKQVKLGTITVSDDYLYRDYQKYATTIDRLSDLVDSYGGYMMIRKDGEQLYLDYLEDFAETANQTIDFGDNLIDIEQTTDVSELATVLIPFGAEIQNEDGSSYIVDIKSVNLDVEYIENTEGIAKYGRIVKVEYWDNVTTPTILKNKAIAHLNKICQPKVKIDVTAADMAKIGSSIDYFKPGQYVRVKSAFHGIDRSILIKAQTLKLLNPESNTMTMSDIFTGFIARSNKNITTINNDISVINSKTNNISIKNESLQNQITVIQEAGYLNAEGVAGIYSEVIEQMQDDINTLRSELLIKDGEIQALIDQNGELQKYIEFTIDGLKMGASNSTIYSLQTESAYKFIDSSGDNTLFEINPEGVIADTYDAKKQVSFSEGDIYQWAIRKGESDLNGHFNLDDVWIGG